MTTEQKAKYIKLLQESDGVLAKAVLFYLTNTKTEFEKKKQFVEKVLDKYAVVLAVSTNRLEEHIILPHMPNQIGEKLISSYKEDFQQEQETEALIAEMNEIF